MTDALSTLANRMSHTVREHEVLRVACLIPGDDPATVANDAIREVLKWAQKRCGGQLPPEAWEHKSFDYLSGGRNSSCGHLQTGTSDLWAIPVFDSVQNAPCGADEFEFDWNGRRFSCEWHIKNGGNTREPSRCTGATRPRGASGRLRGYRSCRNAGFPRVSAPRPPAGL